MDIAPLVGLFLAMAALNVGLFSWLRADMRSGQTDLRADITALRDRMAGLEKELRGDMVALRERMARLEGALTGVSPNSPAAAHLGADDPDPEPRP